MMRRFSVVPGLPRLFAIALFAVLALQVVLAQGRVADRVAQPIDETQRLTLHGNVSPLARAENDQGAADPSTQLSRVAMVFSQTPEQKAALETLPAEQQDRSSPNYHRWLTPEEFGDRFGLSQLDVDKVVAWLDQQGLTVLDAARGRNWVAFKGSAQQVDAALGTAMHRYVVKGEAHYANSLEPSVPAALAGVVMGFRGLNDFRLKPRAVKMGKLAPRFTSGQTGNIYLAPGDFAKIYDLPHYGDGTDGAGQTIAIVVQSVINPSDLAAFRAASGLSASPNLLQVRLTPNTNNPGMVMGDVDEANLDVEWSSAVAEGATILYVYSENVLDAITDVISNDLAPILSTSYGACEADFGAAGASMLAVLAQQANLEGMTVVAASGDNGSMDCDDGNYPAVDGLAVDLPAALPYVTGVGGTEFNEISGNGTYWKLVPHPGPAMPDVNPSALSYIPEGAWNDSFPFAAGLVAGLAASGGGASVFFPKASWQAGAGVPADGARDVPDIAFSASPSHDAYLVCSEDYNFITKQFSPTCVDGFRRSDTTLDAFGGTSFGVPTFAGVVALINQRTGSQGQGNVNPTLYAMASSSPASFHDITTGNNVVPYQSANADPPDCPVFPPGTIGEPPYEYVGYGAGPGYDLVTGLGSIDVNLLVTNWAPTAGNANVTSPSFQLSFSSPSLTVTHGTCGSAKLVVTPLSGFAGTPTFTVSVAPVSMGITPGGFPGFRGWPGVMVLAGILLCWGMIYSPRFRSEYERHTRWSLAPSFGLTCLLAIAIGCGGGGSGSATSTSPATGPPTPAVASLIVSVDPVASFGYHALNVDAPATAAKGTNVVTATATIGGVSQSAQLMLTVN